MKKKQEPELRLRQLTQEEMREALVREAAELEAAFRELDRIRCGVSQRFLRETKFNV